MASQLEIGVCTVIEISAGTEIHSAECRGKSTERHLGAAV